MRKTVISKIGLLLIVLLVAFSLSGCNMLGRAGQLSKLMNSESSKISDMSHEIIRCFQKNDKEGLKELFCDKIKNEPEFDSQLSAAFEYIKGKDHMYEYDIETTSGGGQSTSYGKITAWDVSPIIKRVKTWEGDAPHYYDIEYHWKIVNDRDKALEGIQMMTISLLNIGEITIGESFD